MCGLASKLCKAAAVGALILVSAGSSAEVNPFKKSKNYSFTSEVSWYEKKDSAMKSGLVRDGSDTNFYHLNIDKSRLLLRLGKNDPSGDLPNTRILETLAITDVQIDGRPLPVFEWCLRNQQEPGGKLKQNAVVANDTCVNSGNGGDFIINLDKRSIELLKKAKTLEFEIEPYGRPVRLTYSMDGFAPIMEKITRPAPAPAPAPAAKATAAPAPAKKPARAKMCKAVAPGEFKPLVAPVLYPCNDAGKKAAALATIKAGVDAEKKKRAEKMAEERAAQEAAEREQALIKKRLEEKKKQEAEWDKKQDALWISRCQRHWSKGQSPCYCEKYLDQAPAGVENTCGS